MMPAPKTAAASIGFAAFAAFLLIFFNAWSPRKTPTISSPPATPRSTHSAPSSPKPASTSPKTYPP